MTTQIQVAIDALVAAVRADAPSSAVSFTLFVNSESHEVRFEHRTSEELKRSGCTMRNLRGAFVEEAK